MGAIVLGLLLFGGVFFVGRHVTRNLAPPGSGNRPGKGSRAGNQRGASGGVEAIWAKVRAEDWLDRRKAKREARATRPSRSQRAGSGARSFIGWLRRTAISYRDRLIARVNRPTPDRPWWERLINPHPVPDELEPRRKARDGDRQREPMPAAVPDGPVLEGVPVPRPQRGNGQPRPRPMPRPDPSPAPQTPPSTANGRTPTVASANGSAEKLIEGINEIHTAAVAGNIHAKHAAIKAAIEGQTRFAAMLQMLSRTLSEHGKYGPEITEPLAKAGTAQQAGAMTTSEADAALSTLIGMSVGDLANSPRQAPDRGELTESGSR